MTVDVQIKPRILARLVMILWCISLCTVSVGCDTEKVKKNTPSDMALPPPPFTLEGQLEDLAALDEVVALGGLNLIEESVVSIKRDLTSFLATPLDLRSMWLDNYVQTELLIDPKLVHPKRPLRFLEIADQGHIHTVRILGVLSVEDLKKSLGNYLTIREEKGVKIYVQNRYKDDKSPLHFAILGDELIASTYNVNLLTPRYIKYYQKMAKRRVNGILSAILFPKRAGENWKDLENSDQMVNQLELKGSRRSIQRQKGMLKKSIAFIKQLAADSQRTTFTVKLGQPRITFDMDWSLQPDSLSDRLLAPVNGDEHNLIKYTSAAAVMLSLKLPSPILSIIIQEWNRMALSPLALAPKIKNMPNKGRKKTKLPKALPPILSDIDHIIEDYMRSVKEASKSLNGDLLLAAIPYSLPSKQSQKQAELDESIFMQPKNTEALRWLGLFGHKDLNEAQTAIQQVLSIYKDPQVIKQLRRRGLKIRIKEQKLKFGGEERLTTQIKTRMPRTPPLLKVLRPQLRELYNAHLWMTENLGVIGFADSWKTSFEAIIDLSKDEKPKVSTFIHEAFKSGVEQPIFFFYLDPIKTISSLKRGKAGSILLPLQMMFNGIAAVEGLSFSAGIHSHSVRARLSLPHKLMEAIKSAMSGTPQNAQSPSIASPSEVR